MESFKSPCAVVFEAEVATEGLEDGLDPLADAAEFPEPGLFVLALRSHQVCSDAFGDEPFEMTAGEDDMIVEDQVVVVAQQGFGDFEVPEFRVGQALDHPRPVWRADQIQATAPEVAGVWGAGTVAGIPGQVEAIGRFAAGAARDGFEIQRPEDLVPGLVSLARAVFTGLISVPAAVTRL